MNFKLRQSYLTSQVVEILGDVTEAVRGLFNQFDDVAKDDRGLASQFDDVAKDERGLASQFDDVAKANHGLASQFVDVAKDDRGLVSHFGDVAETDHGLVSQFGDVAEADRGLVSQGGDVVEATADWLVRLAMWPKPPLIAYWTRLGRRPLFNSRCLDRQTNEKKRQPLRVKRLTNVLPRWSIAGCCGTHLITDRASADATGPIGSQTEHQRMLLDPSDAAGASKNVLWNPSDHRNRNNTRDELRQPIAEDLDADSPLFPLLRTEATEAILAKWSFANSGKLRLRLGERIDTWLIGLCV